MSLLKEVQQNTIKAKLSQASKRINDALPNLIDLIKNRSLNGKNRATVELSTLNLDRAEAQALMMSPQLEGFKYVIRDEFITEDSPVGGYSADVLEVSW